MSTTKLWFLDISFPPRALMLHPCIAYRVNYVGSRILWRLASLCAYAYLLFSGTSKSFQGPPLEGIFLDLYTMQTALKLTWALSHINPLKVGFDTNYFVPWPYSNNAKTLQKTRVNMTCLQWLQAQQWLQNDCFAVITNKKWLRQSLWTSQLFPYFIIVKNDLTFGALNLHIINGNSHDFVVNRLIDVINNSCL